MLGVERLAADPARLARAGRVGLLTNPSGVTRDLTPSAVALLAAGVPLARLYGPEHGVDGSGAPGEAPETGADAATGLPTVSLYELTPVETAARLAEVDTLLVDLQDVGARFYTYVGTLHRVLEATRASGTRVVVLDRPNPVGFSVEGPVMRPEFRSLVGVIDLPLRHGLTIGEAGRFMAARLGADLDVIPCDPERFGVDLPWVPPSPNLPELESVTLYPGTCLVEATGASIGRGTALPFRTAGAPGLDPRALAERLNGLGLAGVRFRPHFFIPAADKHAGARCAGVQAHVVGPLPHALPVGVALVGALLEQGVTLNENWLQKLLGISADQFPRNPDDALATCETWRAEGELHAREHLTPHHLYHRTTTPPEVPA